jgi:uncharacterized protein YbjT (DUF2867 family)
MTEHTVVVLGATGLTGRPLLRALAERGARVRAVSRKGGTTTWDSPQIEMRPGDLGDVRSLIAAFDGATSIHYIPPSLNPRDSEFFGNIESAAQKTGVSRFVYHSVLHPHTPAMAHHMRKAETEVQIRHSTLSWTVLQPGMYAQSALMFLDADAGALTPPFDLSRPFTLVDDSDLADAAAIVHTTAGHSFASYELAGPERLDFAAMGDTIGDLLGRSITTRKVDVATVVARIAATRGYNDDQARENRMMFDYYDLHGLVGNPNTLRCLLGREPTTFADAVRRSLALAPAAGTRR